MSESTGEPITVVSADEKTETTEEKIIRAFHVIADALGSGDVKAKLDKIFPPVVEEVVSELDKLRQEFEAYRKGDSSAQES